MTVLHVFDMDGTLLRGSSASLQIAAATGTVAQVAALETAFATGQIDTVGFARGVHRLWRSLTLDIVATIYAGSPWLSGIREVCADIRARGERSAVITMSPDFFARLLLDEGVDEVVASRFPRPPFDAPIDPTGIPRRPTRCGSSTRCWFGTGCRGRGASPTATPFRTLRCSRTSGATRSRSTPTRT